MNLVILEGRLCNEPEVSETTSGSKVSNFKVAVDRYNSQKQKREADFINVTAFGNRAAFIEKWFHKGDPILIRGNIKTGSFTNKEGKKVYTTEVWVDEANFALTRKPKEDQIQDDDFFTKLTKQAEAPSAPDDDFVKIPDDVGDEGLPFN